MKTSYNIYFGKVKDKSKFDCSRQYGTCDLDFDNIETINKIESLYDDGRVRYQIWGYIQYLRKDDDKYPVPDTMKFLLQEDFDEKNSQFLEETGDVAWIDGKKGFYVIYRIERKITRICWNTNNWVKPSGPNGKSQSESSYEKAVGFGNEEWLLDNSRINEDGYHYAFYRLLI